MNITVTRVTGSTLLALVALSVTIDAMAAQRTVCFGCSCATIAPTARWRAKPVRDAPATPAATSTWSVTRSSCGTRTGRATTSTSATGTSAGVYPVHQLRMGERRLLKGRANPDLYLRYINRVNRTGYSNYVYVRGVNTDNSAARRPAGAMANRATRNATSP